MREDSGTVSVVPSSAADQPASSDARVAILSDTHFPRRGRRLCDAARGHLDGATAIIHAGDLCDAEALEELEAIGPPVHAVLGNNDDDDLGSRLSEQLSITIAGVRIGIVHDAGPRAGRLARLRRRFPRHDVVVFGHSHIPLHEEDDDGFQIVNPGSATDHRGRWPVHTVGELAIRDGVATFRLIDLPD